MDVIFLIRNVSSVISLRLLSSGATCLSADCCVSELALCTKEHNAHLITYKLSNNRDLMEKMHYKYYLFCLLVI